MNPLFRNDRRGEHAASWYAASLPSAPPERPPLDGDQTADVAILGAGFTGLWAALTLARAGRRVIVLDAHRVGFGASGRNGGQVHSGFNKPQSWLSARLGPERASALWDLSETAKAQLRDFCAAHAPEADYKPGIAHGEYTAQDLDHLRGEAEFLDREYGYRTEILEARAFRDLVKSPHYVGGGVDPGGGHLHPLAYALALAREAEAAGAIIHEMTEVTAIRPGAPVRFETPHGTLRAAHAIVAGNGYLPALLPGVAARVMPINSFIAATEPLPDRWQEVLAEDIAVSDSRFVVNYYRFGADRRFLFGGRESYSIGFPKDIATALVARMEHLFPQLKGTPVSHVWGGSLAVTVTRLPHVARVAPGVLSGAGFSGQGVALAGMAGRVMAEAVMGQEEGLASFESLPIPTFPGGAAFRAPLLTLAMTWFALRDRLGV
ncbi:FAD-binding oxidoreductase [Roseibacterium sp. SDUM158016]|uniref:NAD(P)/FAD-dependent oxidoreductase n=1 Tax=Roseicyclus sediminis TaxID=2980997 RepID=UPI0021D03310|nr:FAD-binding oxidoreductase [Roseibacterium sp. SDUM158016]MCU4654648.1 FAD-binding oxidoreductase [Roseibacterium sp. SDUM158016]